MFLKAEKKSRMIPTLLYVLLLFIFINIMPIVLMDP